MFFFFFFFSSRRRHTRCSRDWSSDVCSSDLPWTACGATRRSLATASSTSPCLRTSSRRARWRVATACTGRATAGRSGRRSEEHTSELQSRLHLVCRLLLEKKKKKARTPLDKTKDKRNH